MKIVLLGRLNEGEINYGPQKVAQQLFSHLSENGESVEFIEYYFKIYKDSTWIKRFFGFEEYPDNIKRLGVIRLFIYLIRIQPDIIHIVTLERFIITVFFFKFLLRSKFIVTLHSIFKYELPRRTSKPKYYGKLKDYYLEYLAVQHSDCLIFLSKPQLSLAKSFYKFPIEKTYIIPNGIEIYNMRKIKEFDFSSGMNIVFYNGGNEIDRGYEQLLMAIRKAKVPVNLYVLGEGIHTNERGPFVNINYAAMMPYNELIKFLSKMHIVVKSNVIDSFSIFVGECMTMGLIPVISDKIGISEYIVNEVNGFVYDSASIENVSTILENIYYGRYDTSTISKNAQNIVTELNWTFIAEKYLEVYRACK